MVGVFVTFRYGDNFDERAVREIAETARARFEGMPELRSKAFTLNSAKREATNFYVWVHLALSYREPLTVIAFVLPRPAWI